MFYRFNDRNVKVRCKSFRKFEVKLKSDNEKEIAGIISLQIYEKNCN